MISSDRRDSLPVFHSSEKKLGLRNVAGPLKLRPVGRRVHNILMLLCTTDSGNQEKARIVNSVGEKIY
jgi:hypothetical protein